MIKSKFRLTIFLPAGLLIFLVVMTYIILKDVIRENSPIVIVVYAITLAVIFFAWTWLLFGEGRTKAISVIFTDDAVILKRYFGFGAAQQFALKDFEGFTTSSLPSSYGDYEYLYLMKEDIKVIKLSEFYHSNYYEIKQFLKIKMKYKGDMPFSLMAELKEIYQ